MNIDKLIADKLLLHSDENGKLVDYSINLKVLKRIIHYLKPGMNTIETGSGFSTICFSIIETKHISISPYKVEQERIKSYLEQNKIGLDTIFFTGSSDQILPNLALAPDSLDFVLIDGAHRFPFACIDFHFTEQFVKVGGIICVDDVHMPSVDILYQFLLNEKEWELLERVKNTAFFKRVAPTVIIADWQGQEMNRFFKQVSLFKNKISKLIKGKAD